MYGSTQNMHALIINIIISFNNCSQEDLRQVIEELKLQNRREEIDGLVEPVWY